MNVDQKCFLGYGKVVDDVYSLEHVDELKDVRGLPSQSSGHVYACKIEWVSKNTINFDSIKHIRNSHNNNQSINMCKEFNEVDDAAAIQLLQILDDPKKAPSQKTNPFFIPTNLQDSGAGGGEARTDAAAGGQVKPWTGGFPHMPNSNPMMGWPMMGNMPFWGMNGMKMPPMGFMPGMDPNKSNRSNSRHRENSDDSSEKRGNRASKYGSKRKNRHNRSRSRQRDNKRESPVNRRNRRRSRSSSIRKDRKKDVRERDNSRDRHHKKHSKRDRGDKRKRRSNSKDSDNNNSSHAHRKSHRDKEDPKLNLQKNKSVIDDEELGKMFNDLEDNSHPKHKEIDNSEQDKNSYNEKSRSMKSNNDSRNKSASRDKEDNKDYNRKDSKRKRNKKRRHHKKRSEDKNSYNDQQNIESDNIDKSDGENDGDNDEKPGRKIDLRSILLKPAKNNTIYERIKKR